MQEQAKTQAEEKRIFRIIVGSASEAVSVIKTKFGSHATVQSVKQYQPKGVSKLWSNPKLEIIVSVPTNPTAKEPFKIEDGSPQEKKAIVSDDDAMPNIEEVAPKSKQPEMPEAAKTKEAASTGAEADATPHVSLSVEDILIHSEFDRTIVQRLKNMPQWKSVSQRSVQQGLTEVITILREEFIAAQNVSVGSYAAFIGTSGVGKSTMLQKYVANRVFIHGKKVQVLKLDDEDPNPDDMLNVFCEIIGVNLVRDPNDLQLDKGTELYVDLPGISRNRIERVRHFKTILDDLKIRSRVFVMNSLYDSRSLSASYDIARKFDATHQTFTHLDELENWAKLWKFVLRGSLPLIFLNMGDESSAAPKEEFLPLLIAKTFPNILLN